jgi:hypothetical protein
MTNASNELRLLQMNLHKNKERTHGALNDPDTKNYTVIMMQEPYWSDYTKECPSHQSWIRYEPTIHDNTPRAATYVNKAQYRAAEIVQLDLPFKDVVAISIQPKGQQEQPCLIVNVYNPCDESLVKRLHDELVKAKVNEQTSTIIMTAGDFNCHHPM